MLAHYMIWQIPPIKEIMTIYLLAFLFMMEVIEMISFHGLDQLEAARYYCGGDIKT